MEATGAAVALAERNDSDFTKRRGSGLYENEIVSIFHLKINESGRVIAPKPKDVELAERRKIAGRIEALFVDYDGGMNGYAVGWNTAIEAALKEIFNG